MVATETKNRIKKHFAPEQRELPKSEYERYAFFGDCVLDAVATLRELLRSENEATCLKAAEMILNLQQTSIRHGRSVATCVEPMKRHSMEAMENPAYYGEESKPVEQNDELNLPRDPPTEEEAFASHVKEAERIHKRMVEKAAKTDPELAAKLAAVPDSAAVIVRTHLNQWKKKATDITLGGFARAVADGPAIDAARVYTATPLSASGGATN